MAGKDPHWIEHAHLHKGALREKTHTPEGKDISDKRLHAVAHFEERDDAPPGAARYVEETPQVKNAWIVAKMIAAAVWAFMIRGELPFGRPK